MPAIISFSQLLPPLMWIGLSSLFFTVGDIIFRFWIQNTANLHFLGGLIFVCIGMFCLAMSFPSQNIAVATVVAILLNITLYLIAAYFIFGEMITIRESVGLLLGFAAIYILEAMK